MIPEQEISIKKRLNGSSWCQTLLKFLDAPTKNIPQPPPSSNVYNLLTYSRCKHMQGRFYTSSEGIYVNTRLTSWPPVSFHSVR